MAAWLNAVGYQLVWFAAVAGAGRQTPWWGVLAAAVFVAVQVAFSAQRRSDLRLLAVALALGVALDGTLAASGWLHYAAQRPGFQAPLWILAIWSAFALTLNHSLRLLQGRPAWASLLGAVGGPLAYLGAARGFGAVEFVAPAAALIAVALAWALAMPLLSQLALRWRVGTQAATADASA